MIDEERERIEVVVPDQQLSLAIGRRGQNVRLASQLTGWDIDILTEQEESERRQAEFENRTRIFIDALNVDEVIGQLLASEGFNSVEELALVDLKEIASIEGFDEDTARELQTRAREYLAKIEAELDAKRKELGVEDALKEVAGRHHRDAGEVRRERHQDRRGSCRLRHRRPRRLDRTQGRRSGPPSRHSRWLRSVARGGRSDDHAGAAQGRLDHRGRSGAAAAVEEAPAAEAQPEENRRTHDRRKPSIATHDSELDGGPHGRGRERFCVATRTVRPVADLIRFVVGPDGEAVPDLKSKLPGRGVWVTATHDALADAIKRKVFARGFKRDVRLPAGSRRADRAAAWSRRCSTRWLMAGKAGLVAAGFAKAATALAHEHVVALLHAAEASPDGVRKLDAIALRQGPSRSRKLP